LLLASDHAAVVEAAEAAHMGMGDWIVQLVEAYMAGDAQPVAPTTLPPGLTRAHAGCRLPRELYDRVSEHARELGMPTGAVVGAVILRELGLAPVSRTPLPATYQEVLELKSA
jgi:hypothetical protein